MSRRRLPAERTIWRVAGIPEGTAVFEPTVNIFVYTETEDQETAAAIEEAARRAGVHLARIDES